MRDILLGMAVGDAVGVPYEFRAKGEMVLMPCKDMEAYGTHNQPLGTWSDDTTMALCMVDSLCKGWDLKDMGSLFVNWFRNGLWTPHGVVFDMGFTTQEAILKLESGKLPPNMCGGYGIRSNGNGSVMRILPMVDYFLDKNIEIDTLRYRMLSDLSSLTHAHPISVMSCFILVEFGRQLRLDKTNKDPKKKIEQAIDNVLLKINDQKLNIPFNFEGSMHEFDKFINLVPEKEAMKVLSGDGFAPTTVCSAVNCLYHTDNYRDAVLMAVNLGDDTDTTACVTGGLAAILYGEEGIPVDWLNNLVRKDDIIALAEKYERSR